MPASETRAARAGRWLLAIVVPGSALAIGSLVPWLLVVASVLAAVACALLWITPARRTSKAIGWALAAIVLLVTWTCLQALPLPAGVVATLAPMNADIWARSLSPFNEAGPHIHPLSVAPLATHVQILRGLLYTCVFLGGLRVALVDEGTTFLERLLVVSACLVAFGTLAHPLTQTTDKVFGLYTPRDRTFYQPWRIGPLLNPNHLTAYLNAGACVAAGTLIGRRRALPPPLAIGLVLLLAGTSVWVGSRGGMGSLVIGAVLLAGFLIQQRRQHGVLGRLELGATGLVVMAAAMLFGLGSSEIARYEVAGRNFSKLDIIANAFELVPTSYLVGIGRGSFETVFPRVRMDANYATQLAPENIIAQWVVEYGVPVAFVAFVLFALALRPRVVLAAARPAVGPWVAIVVVTLHDLVDFHLEIPGVVVFIMICIAIVVSRQATSSEKEHSARALNAPRWIAFGAAAGTLAAIPLVLPNLEHSVRDDREELARSVLDTNEPDAKFLSEVHRALERCPAEPYFPFIAAVRLQQSGTASPVPWVGRALEAYPRFGRAHLVLGRWLARNHRAQARLEYRLAYAYDAGLHSTIEHEVAFLADSPSSAMELVPEGQYGVPLLDSLASRLSPSLPATSVMLDRELLRRDPSAKGALWRHAAAAKSDLANRHPWCVESTECIEDGTSTVERLIKVEPQSCAARVMLAEVQILAGDTAKGLDGLTTSLDDVPGCTLSLFLLAKTYQSPKHVNLARERALHSDCGTPDECYQLFSRLASYEESHANYVSALVFWKRAALDERHRDDTLTHVAEVSERTGLYGEAVEAYLALEQRHPDDPRYRQSADRLRARSLVRSSDPSAPGHALP